jgi:hypothetical protein
MGLESVFNGEVMEAEFGLKLPQEIEAGFVQADQDDVPRFARLLPGLLHRDLRHAAPGRICDSGDNAGLPVRGCGYGLERLIHVQPTPAAPARCRSHINPAQSLGCGEPRQTAGS